MSKPFRTPAPGQLDILKKQLQEYKTASELPHLYGWNWYPWARKFYESRNRTNLLCAANQISKSSTQIRKCIEWATNKDLWPELWRKDVWEHTPLQFWYLYPTRDVVAAEFETKWKQFLPRGEMKKDPYYGWDWIKDGRYIQGIKFKSGTLVLFKTYAQNPEALQSGSVAAIFCDEELDVELYDELTFRTSATEGYFHMVFTATKGQDFWRRAMEPEEGEQEELPHALKICVSLYEALEYEDGTKSHWSLEKIKEIEAKCSTESEVLKRVYGRFILVEGRKYESFELKRHKKAKHPVPASWHIYEGVDIGSGGAHGHRSAIVFVAVRPDYREGRVFLGWRGDKEITTAGDVFQKHLTMVKENNLKPLRKWYDWGNKDFGVIATRAGDPFEKAEKSHEKGEEVLNTLFKNNMLFIYDDSELAKLCAELATLKKETNKRKAKDDFVDALRYCVTLIPWDWSFLSDTPSDFIEETPEAPLTDLQRQIAERRKAFDQSTERERLRIEDEFAEANASYEL